MYIYIYIYAHRHSTDAQFPTPSFPSSFHCAGGSLSAGSSWHGPLEISCGKVRIQRGSRPRVPLIPVYIALYTLMINIIYAVLNR